MSNVTLSTCNKRTAWIVGLFLTSISVILVMVGMAISAGNGAREDAAEVKTELHVHAAAQEERDEHVSDTLDEIKITVKETNTNLNRALRERHFSGGD